MKKWLWFTGFLAVYLMLCALAACAAGEGGAPAEGADGTDVPEAESSSVTCRVVTELDGQLLLAEEDGSGIYTVVLDGPALTLDGAPFDPAEPGAYQALPGASLAGAAVTVTFSGGVQESWPMGFSGLDALDFSTAEFDNLGALYVTVLEDLWCVDSGLNENITELGVDLSATRLTESEQAAVAWAFGQSVGLAPIQATWEELVEQGTITASPLLASGSDPESQEPEHFFYEWEDGCLFSITETDEPVIFNTPAMGPLSTEEADWEAVSFNAQKWRTSLGAYGFSRCAALRHAGGAWTNYTVGDEYIS